MEGGGDRKTKFDLFAAYPLTLFALLLSEFFLLSIQGVELVVPLIFLSVLRHVPGPAYGCKDGKRLKDLTSNPHRPFLNPCFLSLPRALALALASFQHTMATHDFSIL